MGGQGINASLSVQVEKLKKSMQSRDTRRTHDRLQRQVERNADPYETHRAVDTTVGSSPMGDAALATAAVANAAALAGPEQHFCDLCQVSFPSEAQIRQHREGPTHRKAMAKAAAQREREERLGAFASAAQEAVAAAAWAEGGKLPGAARDSHWHQLQHRSPGRGSGHSVGAHQSGRPQQQGLASRGARAPGAVPAPAPVASHAQLLANARRTAEPLTINGWVPPNLANAPAQPAFPSTLPEQHQPGQAGVGGARLQESSSPSSGETQPYKVAPTIKSDPELADTAAGLQHGASLTGPDTNGAAAATVKAEADVKLEAEAKPEADVKLEAGLGMSKPAHFEADAMGLGALAGYSSNEDSHQSSIDSDGKAGDVVTLGFF